MPGRVVQWRFILGGNARWIDIGSDLIARFSAGHLSHVDSIIPDEGLSWAPRRWLYGARNDKVGKDFAGRKIPAGVQLRPPGYTSYRRCVIATIPVTDQQFADFWQAEHEKIGLPYDSEAIWAFVFNRDWREKDSWICSEKNMDSAEIAKFFWTSKLALTPNKMTPVFASGIASTIPGTYLYEVVPGTDPWVEVDLALNDFNAR